MVDATGYTGNRHSDQAFGKFPPIYRPDEPNPHECTGPEAHYVGRKVGFVGHWRKGDTSERRTLLLGFQQNIFTTDWTSIVAKGDNAN